MDFDTRLGSTITDHNDYKNGKFPVSYYAITVAFMNQHLKVRD